MLVDSPALRERIYADVLAQAEGGGTPIERDWLLNYTIDGERLPLIDAQGRGIRNVREPVEFATTLSILTVDKGKYGDLEIEPGMWAYPLAVSKSGELDPSNTKLFRAHEYGTPVLFFYKPVPKVLLIVGMVRITAIDLGARTSTIELVERSAHVGGSIVECELELSVERAWVRNEVKVRLHQPRFRAIVLDAYAERCAVCALPEASLLDAAHIRPDGDPNGEAHVRNGLALCAIHHRAYDKRHIGIDEEFGLHVRPSLLDVSDGPVLEHAIQRLDGTRLSVLPPAAKRPDPYLLGLTFKEFQDLAS